MKENQFSQKNSDPVYSTLNDWILNETIPFSIDSSESLNAAIDRLVISLNNTVELLGLGEALHGSEDILILRNRLFQRLVEKHGYSSIAIESSFLRGHIVNEYITGLGPESYEAIQDTGFSHGFGRLEANRELIEWMKFYNADSSHQTKLHFYGFDSPTEMTTTDSPRQVLNFVLDYLSSIDGIKGQGRSERIYSLLGQDSNWENPAAMLDPTKSIGLSPAATSLRIETEDLISELRIRSPELIVKSGKSRYLEALHYACMGRQLLNYHAALAQESSKRIVEGLGIRDLMMADNLEYIVSRERGRGKVFAFAHNSHMKLGKAQWQLGPELLIWWPAGAHLNEKFGSCYAVIGSTVGISDANGLAQPEAGTLEAQLTAVSEPVRFIPTHRSKGLPAEEIKALPTRSGSIKNPTYFALTPQSFTDFDWLVILDSTVYARGGTLLQE
jgi:erythromycin esterase